MEIVTRQIPVRQPAAVRQRTAAPPAAPAVLEILQRQRESGNPWRPGRVVLQCGRVAVGSFRLLPNGWVEVQDDEIVRDLELQLDRLQVELGALRIPGTGRESDAESDQRVNLLPRRIRELRAELDRRQDVTSELVRAEDVDRIEVLREVLEPRIEVESFDREAN